MLAIAGHTAGPNWLNIFKETHGFPGGTVGFKESNFFSLKF